MYQVVSDASDEALENVEYRLEFDKPTAICGPIALTLWASTSATDTDFFVVLSDIAPDGRVRALQRGMLRASLRAIDEQQSTWINLDSEEVLIPPRHTFENPMPMESGNPYRLEIEVFPMGHVFREGHQLLLSIGQPPHSDPVPYPKGRKGAIKSGSYKIRIQTARRNSFHSSRHRVSLEHSAAAATRSTADGKRYPIGLTPIRDATPFGG